MNTDLFAPPHQSARPTTVRKPRPPLWRRAFWAAPLLVVVAGLGLAVWPAAPPPRVLAAPNFALSLAWASGLPRGVVTPSGTLSLKALRGHPIVLNFMNSNCDACKAEAGVLNKAAAQYRSRGIVVLGVATGGDTRDTALRFAALYNLPYPVVVDGGAAQGVSWAYGVGAFPHTIFIDAKGMQRGQHAGELDAGIIRDGLAESGAVSCTDCHAVATPGPQHPDPVVIDSRAAPAFSLRDQKGALLSPASFKGKVVALTFVSDVCTEECPLVGAALTRAARDLGADAAHLAIVAISVAPEEDTPAATYQFAAHAGWLRTDWHYLTGSRAALQKVWRAYGVGVDALSPIYKPSTSVVHDAGVYIIDPQGRWRSVYPSPFTGDAVAGAVRALLPS